MKFSLEKYSGISIHSYDTGLLRLTIQQMEHFPDELSLEKHENGLYQASQALIVSPSTLQAWDIDDIEQLDMKRLAPILSLEPEIVLIGTGRAARFPSSENMQTIYKAGLGVDFMDTAAACRTYNILHSEGRHVVAAIMMI